MGAGVDSTLGAGEVTGGAIVPRFITTDANVTPLTGPKFPAASETAAEAMDKAAVTPSLHLDTSTVYLAAVPVMRVTSHDAPLRLKSEIARPVTAFEKVRSNSKVCNAVGDAGATAETVGTVLSMTTSVLIESTLGPATVPVIELARSFKRYSPGPQPEAVTL